MGNTDGLHLHTETEHIPNSFPTADLKKWFQLTLLDQPDGRVQFNAKKSSKSV